MNIHRKSMCAGQCAHFVSFVPTRWKQNFSGLGGQIGKICPEDKVIHELEITGCLHTHVGYTKASVWNNVFERSSKPLVAAVQ